MKHLTRHLWAFLLGLALAVTVASFAGDLESSNFSETAANNNAASPNGAPEGMAPSGVNDTIREVMGALKRDWNRSHCTLASTGSANTYAIAFTTEPAAYVDGAQYCFRANFANTGSATANINALGATTVQKQTSTGLANLASGDIQIGQHVVLEYDSGAAKFILLSPQFGAGLTLPVSVANGGTGLGTLTAHGVLIGAGTSNVAPTAAGTAGQMLQSGGASADPGWANALGYRDLLINGALEIWQRGAGGSASIAVSASTTAYTADRWYLATGANEAFTVSQQSGLTTGAHYSARVQRNSGQTGTAAVYFAQPLDSDVVATIAGQTVTVSFTVSTGANWSPSSGTLICSLYTGTTNAPAKRGGTAFVAGDTQAGTLSQNLAQGASAARFSFTTSTLGSAITQAEVQCKETPVGTASTNDWFQIGDVQLEIGSTATTFDLERRNFALELAQSQRFYQKSFPYGTAPAQNAGTAGCLTTVSQGTGALAKNAYLKFSVVMRGTPSMTAYNPSAANSVWRNISGGADAGASSFTATGDSGVTVVEASSTDAIGSILGIHVSADAEL